MQFSFIGALEEILAGSGFAALFSDPRSLVMILIAFVLLFLGIGKKFEPLLLYRSRSASCWRTSP